MSNKPQDKAKNETKRIPNYERKLEARRKQAEKERRNKKQACAAAILICLCIIGVVLYSVISSALNKKAVLNNAYITIGEHEITELEYAFYYNYTANNYLNYYSSIGLLPYMGLDTSVDFAKQQYSDTMTWKDFFDQMTVEQIKMTKLMLDDAKTKGFEYDASDDYVDFQASFKEGASEAGVSVSDYYKAMYGSYATEKNIKPFILDGYIVSAYDAQLLEQNKPSDAEITEHYEENKADYDKVDYRNFTFTAEIEDDASEEEINTAMKELKEKAEAMKALREAGEDFEALCIQYASEDDKADYEDEEKDNSLNEGMTKSYILSYYNDDYSNWLFDEKRQEGDITIIEDLDNNNYHVVEFVQRMYDETCKDTISDKLARERVDEYLKGYTDNYVVKDVKGELVYLTIETEEEEETE